MHGYSSWKELEEASYVAEEAEMKAEALAHGFQSYEEYMESMRVP